MRPRRWKPEFAVRKEAGILWLYDRNHPVICFDRDRVVFGHGRFRPGGYEMFPAPGTHWSGGGFLRPFWGNTWRVMRELKRFETRVKDDTARFRVVSRPEGGIMESDWRMTVSFSAGTGSYVYEVLTRALVTRPPEQEQYNPIEFEYFDLYPTGLLDNSTAYQFYRNGQHVPVPGPLWGWLVYEPDVDVYGGNLYWTKAPLNRLITAGQNNVRVRRNGWIGFMDNALGNPMIQLLDDTAAVSRVDMCNWFYDLHFNHVFKYVKEPPPKGTSATAHFRLTGFPSAFSRPILASSVLAPSNDEEKAAKAYPRYEPSGLNSFEVALALDRPDHSKVWRPFHDHPLYTSFGLCDVRWHGDGKRHVLFPEPSPLSSSGESEQGPFRAVMTNPSARCTWDRTFGRTGAASLKVETRVSCRAGWSLPVFEAPQVAPGRRYRLSVWIRTRNLAGKGATLACFPRGYESPLYLAEKNRQKEKKPLFAADRVQGTAGWRRVEVITPPMENPVFGKTMDCELRACVLQPVLWHEGRGVSWFDDFRLEPLD